jgi:hypothetical protein
LVVLLVLAGLAGCLEPGVDTEGQTDCCGDGGAGGDPGPVETLDFEPALLRLKRDFCANQTFELPAPRFGMLRFAGVEDRLYDGPMPCTVILDPATSDEERTETSVFIDITEASSSGVAFTIDSHSTATVSNLTVYGAVSFVAPAGAWGDAGGYEVGYDPREEDREIVSTMARLMVAPQG